MPRPKHWELWSLVPIVAGLFWLLADSSFAWRFWGLAPGLLLLGSGVALLLWPGDVKVTQYMAAGGFIGVCAALPALFVDGDAVLAGVLSVAAYLVAGYSAIVAEPVPEDVPPPEMAWPNYAKAALDEALLAYFNATAIIPSGARAEQVGEELLALRAALDERGFLKNPERAHKAPPAPGQVHVSRRSILGRDFEVLRHPSDFVCDPLLPGAARWTSYHSNDHTAAWVMRHSGGARPWLMCIHGYRMGTPLIDFALFPPRWLHERLGLNLIMPILPLHGPRTHGWRSGDEYLDGDFTDLYHAQCQALWDLRRTLAWLRTQEDNPRIGVMGYSLGGYNAALLAQYERDLDFVIAGIPATDLASSLWRQIPAQHKRFFAPRGIGEELFREVLSPVSPMARPPLPSREKLRIFAGVTDRLIPPEQVLKLSRHWRAPVEWYQGAHLTFRHERGVRRTVEEAMLEAGWSVPATVAMQAAGAREA